MVYDWYYVVVACACVSELMRMGVGGVMLHYKSSGIYKSINNKQIILCICKQIQSSLDCY